MLGTNVRFVWPPHVQQWPTMPNNVGTCWDKCWHRLARALVQWFIEPFEIGKIECAVCSNLEHMYISICCGSAQTGQAERDVTDHTSGVNQTTEPLKLTHKVPGARSNPV